MKCATDWPVWFVALLILAGAFVIYKAGYRRGRRALGAILRRTGSRFAAVADDTDTDAGGLV